MRKNDKSLGEYVGMAFIVVIFIFIALIFISIIGSYIRTIDEGVVINKHYEPPRTGYIRDEHGGRTTHYGADYMLKVKGIDENGAPKSEWWHVSEYEYSTIQVGDYVYLDDTGDIVVVDGGAGGG